MTASSASVPPLPESGLSPAPPARAGLSVHCSGTGTPPAGNGVRRGGLPGVGRDVPGKRRRTDPNLFLIGPRACGKSTVGLSLQQLRPGWRLVDLDREFHRRHVGPNGSMLRMEPDRYYRLCHEIIDDYLGERQVIMALGGGTLVNSTLGTASDLAIECKKYGPMVLVLPSRFEFLCKRALFKRERGRQYDLPRQALERLRDLTYSQFDQRIVSFRALADFTVYGSNPAKLAKTIAEHYLTDPG